VVPSRSVGTSKSESDETGVRAPVPLVDEEAVARESDSARVRKRSGVETLAARARTRRLLYLGLIAVALGLRLPAVFAAFPYLHYVDEGAVLHPVVHILATGSWDPNTYEYHYGALPEYLIALGSYLYEPVFRAAHGKPLRAALSPDPPSPYSRVEPPDLVVLARLLGLVLALGCVLLVGRLATQAVGAEAGLLAAWLAALLPALVIRSATVNVDIYCTFFVLAALVLVEGLRGERRPWRDASLAGAMCGCALATKYPAVLVCLAVVLAIALGTFRWPKKLGLLAAAAGAGLLAAALAMPPLVLKPREVIGALRFQAATYSRMPLGSFWEQAVRRAEWDQPLDDPELGYVFLALSAGGLILALLDPRLRRPVLGWLLFAGSLAWLYASYPFRPFRNLLPHAALCCVLVAVVFDRLRRTSRVPARALYPAAAALPLVLFAPALWHYIDHQVTRVDSRHQAIVWLAANSRPQDSILMVDELTILDSEMESLAAYTEAVPWDGARALLRKGAFSYAVLGDFRLPGEGPMPPRVWAPLLKHYELKARFGEEPGIDSPYLLHGNRETVYILRRLPREPGARNPGS
jgi:hypothetical protein